MLAPEDITSATIFAVITPAGTPALGVTVDAEITAYWDAVIEVRRYWQAIHHEAPTTDEAKAAHRARLGGLITQAQTAAAAVGVEFTAADFM